MSRDWIAAMFVGFTVGLVVGVIATGGTCTAAAYTELPTRITIPVDAVPGR